MSLPLPPMPKRSPTAITLRWLLALGVAIFLLWLLGQVLLLVFAAVLLAILLAAPARWLSGRSGLRYGYCLAAVVLAMVLALAGIALAIAPQLAAQIDQISGQLPQALHQLVGSIEATSLGRMLLGQIQAADGQPGAALAGPILHSVSSLVVAIGSIAFVVVVGLYLAAAPSLYRRGALRLVPPARCARLGEIFAAVGATLKYFLFGRLFSMGIIALCSMAGLWALGIPAPIAFGLLAGAMSFVPYVGSAASGVPPLLLAYVQSPVAAAYVVLLYLAIHLLDGYILVPLVQKRMVHLPPAVTLGAQLVFGILWGLLGVAVATPIAAALITVIEMSYVQDVLRKGTGAESAGVSRRAIAEPAAPD